MLPESELSGAGSGRPPPHVGLRADIYAAGPQCVPNAPHGCNTHTHTPRACQVQVSWGPVGLAGGRVSRRGALLSSGRSALKRGGRDGLFRPGKNMRRARRWARRMRRRAAGRCHRSVAGGGGQMISNGTWSPSQPLSPHRPRARTRSDVSRPRSRAHSCRIIGSTRRPWVCPKGGSQAGCRRRGSFMANPQLDARR